MTLSVAILVFAVLAVPAESLADSTAGERKAQLCLLCHRVAHASAPLSTIPLLDGQPATYLYLQTKAFKERRRDDHVMQTNVATLSDQDMRDIADYLSALEPFRGSYQLDPATVMAGKIRADELKCATCHLTTYVRTKEIPRLAGQTPGYLRAQLGAFGSGTRHDGGGQHAAALLTLSERDMEALAQFLASLE